MKSIIVYIQQLLLSELDYKILIYDDDTDNINLYKNIIQFSEKDKHLLNVYNNNIIYCSDYTKIDDILKNEDIKIVILDIIIKNYTFDNLESEKKYKYGGIELYNKLVSKYKNIEIDFISALNNTYIDFNLLHSTTNTPIFFQRTELSINEMIIYIKNKINTFINSFLLLKMLKYLDTFININSPVLTIFDETGKIIISNEVFLSKFPNITNIKKILTHCLIDNKKDNENINIDNIFDDIINHQHISINNFGIVAKINTHNYITLILNEDTNNFHNKYIELKNKYDNILTSIPDLIWTNDLEGKPTYSNQLDYITNIIKSNIPQLNDVTEMDKFVKRYNKQINKTIYNEKDNSTYNVIKSPLLDYSGNLIGTTGVARNISIEKVTETILSSVFNTFLDVAIIHCNSNFKLIYFNTNVKNLSILNNKNTSILNKNTNKNEINNDISLVNMLNKDVYNTIITNISNSNKNSYEFNYYDTNNNITYNILIIKSYTNNPKQLFGYTIFFINKNNEIEDKQNFTAVKQILHQQIENSNDMVIIFNKDRKVFLSNKNAKRIFERILNYSLVDGVQDYAILENLNLLIEYCVVDNTKCDSINNELITEIVKSKEPFEISIKWRNNQHKNSDVTEPQLLLSYYKIFSEIYHICDTVEYVKLDIKDITDFKHNEFLLMKEINKQKLMLRNL